jgi:hypothetical protein
MKKEATIHILLGDDTVRARAVLMRSVEEEKAKDPMVLVSRFDDLSFDAALLAEALQQQSIFGGRGIVVIDGILDHEDGEEFYRQKSILQDSPHAVFIRETAPKKEIVALFKEIGTVEEFPLRKIIEKNTDFAIADAVAMRDKRAAWVELVKQQRAGASMEEVHGKIFWAVKTLYLCATQTKEEVLKAGVKDFTYRNYQPRSKNFLVHELEEKLGELKHVYHRAHQGDAELGLFLEQFLLKL